MSSGGVYLTHDANRIQNREDLLDIITMLSPNENPVHDRLENGSKPTNVYHEYLRDELARATTTGATVEGIDNQFAALTSPTRAVNYVQEITEWYKVSSLQEAVDTAGPKTLARHRMRALIKVKNKIEYSLILATGNSGASNTAREMKGILTSLSKATNASSASTTEAVFNNYLNGIWDDVADDTMAAFMDMRIKRAISANFITSTVKNLEAKATKLQTKIDVYQSDVAKDVELYGHRDLKASNRMFIIQPRAFKKAYMVNPKDMDVPSTGNWTGGKVYTALTLEALYPAAGMNVTNIG